MCHLFDDVNKLMMWSKLGPIVQHELCNINIVQHLQNLCLFNAY